jgi:hypothetical protein
MSRNASTEFDWADGRHSFRLPIGQLLELQEKTGHGPQSILTRLINGTWFVNDVTETIRLGLIGGGMKPDQAYGLIKRYVHDRPLQESIQPAIAILGSALIGTDQEETPGKTEAGETAPGESSPMDGSPSPVFMEQA